MEGTSFYLLFLVFLYCSKVELGVGLFQNAYTYVVGYWLSDKYSTVGESKLTLGVRMYDRTVFAQGLIS